MIGAAGFAVVGLLFLLAAIHAFTATLYQALFGRLPNTTLGAVALVVFAASLLAVVPAHRLGARRAVAWTGGVLAVSTVLFVAIRQEWVDLVLSAAAVAAGTQWLALLHSSRSPTRASPIAAALPLALIADLVLRSVFGTIPVAAAPIVLAVPMAVVAGLLFLAAGIAALPAGLAWTAPDARGALGLVALAPLVFVAETGAANGAQIAAAGGLAELPAGTQIGLLLAGAGFAAGALALTRPWPARPVAAAALAVGAAGLWVHVPAVSLAGGALLAAGVLLAARVLPAHPSLEARSPWRAVVALGIGWIAFVAAAFAYYAFYGILTPVWALTALAAVAVLAVPSPPLTRVGSLVAVVAAVAALLAPAAGIALTPGPAVRPAPTTSTRLVVMTYNVHQGFDAGDIPSLDRIADAIALEDPDVVVLEEVVRGWLIDDQQDVLGYLAARLRLAYVFAPNIGDLYGNAILSRYPMTDVVRIHYPKEPGARYQPRGAVLVRIAGVLVAGTHLDEHDDATAVRQTQMRQLLDELGAASPALLLCDCNAPPEALELRLVDEAGFGDLALQAGGGQPTFPADRPERRLDYVFGRGVIASQGRVVGSTASDHRGVVVNVTVPR